jgi:hypothetical protein
VSPECFRKPLQRSNLNAVIIQAAEPRVLISPNLPPRPQSVASLILLRLPLVCKFYPQRLHASNRAYKKQGLQLKLVKTIGFLPSAGVGLVTVGGLKSLSGHCRQLYKEACEVLAKSVDLNGRFHKQKGKL